MDKKLTRVQLIGVGLIKGQKLSKDDISFLQKYYRSEAPEYINNETLITMKRSELTRGQRARQTNLLKYQ